MERLSKAMQLALLMLALAFPAIAEVRPNFLFVLVDDLGCRDLGVEGSVFHETPNIDALANSGLAIEYVYAMRTDDASLTYWLEVSDELVSPTWTNQGYTVVATNVTDGLFDMVSNSVPVDASQKFIRLVVEQE